MQYLPLVSTYADFNNMEMSFAFKIKQIACYNTYTHFQSIQNICYYNNMVLTSLLYFYWRKGVPGYKLRETSLDVSCI